MLWTGSLLGENVILLDIKKCQTALYASFGSNFYFLLVLLLWRGMPVYWACFVCSPMLTGISFCNAFINVHATATTASALQHLTSWCICSWKTWCKTPWCIECLSSIFSNSCSVHLTFLCKSHQLLDCPMIFLCLAWCRLTWHTPWVLLTSCQSHAVHLCMHLLKFWVQFFGS